MREKKVNRNVITCILSVYTGNVYFLYTQEIPRKAKSFKWPKPPPYIQCLVKDKRCEQGEPVKGSY